ncbi:helicase-related protein [Ramlibacter alkalitolerans]|uniref:helicase-related protein n=1 Tax=Ramlibacter alkalitolerans TaxID=2039631 RepID=UPI002ED5139B
MLTERTEHVSALVSALSEQALRPFVLHGRLSKKQRGALMAELEALAPDAPRVLLATGKLVGEGFDHPPLDTLILAMPVSWKGTLQQYAGRASRARGEVGRTDHRLRRFRSPGVVADVGEAAARLPRDTQVVLHELVVDATNHVPKSAVTASCGGKCGWTKPGR